MSIHLASVLTYLIPVVTTVLVALIGRSIQYLGFRLTQTQHATFLSVDAQCQTLVHDIVVSLNQRLVNPMKSHMQWDTTAATKTQAQAFVMIDSLLSASAKKVLSQSMTDVSQYLEMKIKSQVATAPNKWHF